jgi:hypothetical protein
VVRSTAATFRFCVAAAPFLLLHFHDICLSTLFVWLISHQTAVLFSQKKPATSNQQLGSSTFLSEQISISHQPPAKRTGFYRAASAPVPVQISRGKGISSISSDAGAPNLSGPTRSSFVVAWVYIGAELGDMAWEHEPPSSFREVTIGSSLRCGRGFSAKSLSRR